jgi:hypothetical protein
MYRSAINYNFNTNRNVVNGYILTRYYGSILGFSHLVVSFGPALQSFSEGIIFKERELIEK